MALPVYDGFDVGETALVTITLTQGGQPVTATVTAMLRWRNDVVVEVDADDVVDEGGGVYSVRFACSKAGDWHLRVAAASGDDTGVEEIVVRVEPSAIVRT